MSLDRYTMRAEPARAREWAEMDRSGNSRHRAKYMSCMPGLRASRGNGLRSPHIYHREMLGKFAVHQVGDTLSRSLRNLLCD